MSQHLRQVDLNLLRVFVAVYRHGNISRAAEDMRVSQPTMSNALSRLREALDDRLFVRTTGGVTPTSRADELIGPIRRILADVDAITRPEGDFDPLTTEREFTMSILDSLEDLIMPGLIADSMRNRNLSFKLLLSAGTPAGKALHSGQAEIVVNLPTEIHSDLLWHPLFPIDPVIVARKDHPRFQGSMSKRDLASASWILLDLTPGALANSNLLRADRPIDRREAVKVSRVGSMLSLVVQSDAVSLVPRKMVQSSPLADKLQIFEHPQTLTEQHFNMTWHARTNADPGLVWLRKRIIELSGTDARRDVSAA